MPKYIEVTGNINKEEITEALLKHKLKNTFVLIDDKPYPGYHYHKINKRLNIKDISLFLVLKKRYTWASIIRATAHINNLLDKPIETSLAKISLFNVDHYAIKINSLNEMESIETIQESFQEEGFEFMKNKRMSKPRATFFQVKTFFDIEKVEESIFIGKNGNYYLIIDRKIEWELFRKITKNVKLNISDDNYDVVNGAFYMNTSLVDFIRVYKPDITMVLLKEIQEEYNKQINKYF